MIQCRSALRWWSVACGGSLMCRVAGRKVYSTLLLSFACGLKGSRKTFTRPSPCTPHRAPCALHVRIARLLERPLATAD